MNYKTYMNSHETLLPTFNKIYDLQAIKLVRAEKGLQYRFHDSDKLEAWERELVMQVVAMGTANMTEFYITMMTIGQTPRIIKADAFMGETKWNNTPQKAFELLENVRLNLTVDDYQQTFPTMVFELPHRYCTKYELPCPQGNEENALGHIYPLQHQPCFVIINHNPEVCELNCSVVFDSLQSIKLSFTNHGWNDEDLNLEESLNKIGNSERIFEDSIATSKEEMHTAARVARACLNAALLCKKYQLVEIGKDNPTYYNRLERWSQLKKNKNIKQQLLWKMRQMPIYYKLHIKPKLYRTKRTTGGTISPHVRNAYWKMQHSGPGNVDRHPVYIESVFVNEHLLAND